jgi:hypothetical protein
MQGSLYLLAPIKMSIGMSCNGPNIRENDSGLDSTLVEMSFQHFQVEADRARTREEARSDRPT